MNIATVCSAQFGYAITNENDTIKGYVKYQRNYLNNHLELEIWKTKRDKNPQKFPLNQFKEYTFKKDTFRILTNCIVDYHDRIAEYDKIEFRLEQNGKLTLYSNYSNSSFSIPGGPGGGMMTYSTSSKIYFIADENGNI
ncbi:hypothetical protein, partial [Fulvivirga lutimaris]|uniref:hypothetical protein n=1 Tax=Fulvivirga lutimaris TaxID=1819566 RepID=UPI0012BC74C3